MRNMKIPICNLTVQLSTKGMLEHKTILLTTSYKLNVYIGSLH